MYKRIFDLAVTGGQDGGKVWCWVYLPGLFGARAAICPPLLTHQLEVVLALVTAARQSVERNAGITTKVGPRFPSPV